MAEPQGAASSIREHCPPGCGASTNHGHRLVSDDSVRQALRSDAGLVVVEAPAGCGKTHQGADYVGEVAGNNRDRVLILTHTHAACSVFAERTLGIGPHVEIRTIERLVAHVATACHTRIGVTA